MGTEAVKLTANGPKVSVVMPTYGPTLHLSAAIASVRRQTWRNFELLIVDDNNPDTSFRRETEHIVTRHQEQGQGQGQDIIYIQHEKNRNGAAARNTGISRATGDYISFLDSDDIYDPRRLEVAVGLMGSAEDRIGGVYSGVEFRRGGKVYASHRDVEPGNFLLETLACKFLIGTGSNLFVRRSVVNALGGFDESFLRHQDYEFLVRLFSQFDLAASREILVIKNNENLNLPGFSKTLAIKEQYLEKFRSLIESLSPADRDYVMRSNYTWLGEHALREGLREESRAMYGVAGRYGKARARAHMRRAAFWVQSWLK